MSDSNQKVKDVIEILKIASPFDADAHFKSVYDKVRDVSDTSFLDLASAGSNASGSFINGIDCKDLLTKLANQSTAEALSGLSNVGDPKGLRGAVDAVFLPCLAAKISIH